MEKNTEEFRRWLEATRDEPLESMAGFFDACTEQYEAHMAPWTAQYQWMARELPSGTRRLLDLGCGTGLELDCIFRRLPDLEVTGVDLAGGMLDLLRRKHRDKALTLVQADYFAWEPESGLFDAVVAFETLHHVSAAQRPPFLPRYTAGCGPAASFWSATTSPPPLRWRRWPLPSAPAAGPGTGCRRTSLFTSTRPSLWSTSWKSCVRVDLPRWRCLAVCRRTTIPRCCGRSKRPCLDFCARRGDN